MTQIREASIKYEAKAETLDNQVRSLQQQLLESERKGQRGLIGTSGGASAATQGISREAELIISGLKDELNQEREHLAHYRTIAEQREKAMTELQQARNS